MKRRRRSGRLGPVVTVGTLALIGLLWVRLFFVQPKAEGLFEPADSRQTQIAERKLGELSSVVERLSDAARQGKSSSTTLQFSAAEINAMIAAEPDVQGALAEARINSPEVQLKNGRITTTASVDKGTVAVPVTAEGELAARHGMLLYASDRVRVAGVPASPSVQAAVDGRIQAVFGQIQQRVRARVQRVTVGRTRITLYLGSRPE